MPAPPTRRLAPAQLAARNTDMVRRRRQGESLQSIGDRYGITRARVEQVVTRIDPDAAQTAHQAKSEQRAAAAADAVRARTLLVERVRRDLHDNGPATREHLAAKFGVPPADVPVPPDIAHLVIRDGAPRGTNGYTWDDLLAAIRDAADAVGEPLSTGAYETYHQQRRDKSPSSATLFNRFGGWTKACAAAGVTPGVSGRKRYDRRWTRDDCVDWVVRWMAEPAEVRGTTCADFGLWLLTQPGAPSASTVRNRVGLPWDEIKQAAFARAHPQRVLPG